MSAHRTTTKGRQRAPTHQGHIAEVFACTSLEQVQVGGGGPLVLGRVRRQLVDVDRGGVDQHGYPEYQRPGEVPALFSLSYAAPHLFGDRVAEFEAALRALLRRTARTECSAAASAR